jgi:hypothetical protein
MHMFTYRFTRTLIKPLYSNPRLRIVSPCDLNWLNSASLKSILTKAMSNSLVYNNNSLAGPVHLGLQRVAAGTAQLYARTGRDANGQDYQEITVTPTQYCRACGHAYYNPVDSVRNNSHDLEFSLTRPSRPIMFSRCASVVAHKNDKDLVGSQGGFGDKIQHMGLEKKLIGLYGVWMGGSRSLYTASYALKVHVIILGSQLRRYLFTWKNGENAFDTGNVCPCSSFSWWPAADFSQL